MRGGGGQDKQSCQWCIDSASFPIYDILYLMLTREISEVSTLRHG